MPWARRKEETQISSCGTVKAVAPAGAAARAGIVPGDRLISLNGSPLRDVIDFRFHLEQGENQIEVERDGRRMLLMMDAGPGDDPGIRFASAVFGPVRTCRSRCVFCFVDQLPRGLRRSLYLKDDDFRLSFLYGNFMTLGGLTEEDLARIIAQRLSPLYVSVHATDPDVRAGLMGTGVSVAENGLDTLRRLGEAGIRTHVQIVLCPGLNDGSVLERTVRELAGDYPSVASAGVVPVAVSPDFTRRRLSRSGREAWKEKENANRAAGLRPLTRADCLEAAEQVEALQKEMRQEGESGFVYAADELYLRSGRALPSSESYDGFPQYQNGIGMAASFARDAAEMLRPVLRRDAQEHQKAPDRIFLLSGTLAEDHVARTCGRLSESLRLDIRPLVAENRVFGPHVTVTGLLGGGEIRSAADLAGLGRGDLLLVPSFCLDGGRKPRFLDDMTLEALARELDCRVAVGRLP